MPANATRSDRLNSPQEVDSHAFPSQLLRGSIVAAVFLPLCAAAQSARVNMPAPDFTAKDSSGQTQTLSQYHGKYVVLEWHNQGSPYTRKHYVSGNMQALQKEWTAKGVVWFTVISSAPGSQGYVTPSQENAYLAQMHAVPTAVLMDPDGKPRSPVQRKDHARHVRHRSVRQAHLFRCHRRSTHT